MVKIESINHKGHQLNELPDSWYNGIVSYILKIHNSFGDKVFKSVESTQIIAKQELVDNNKSMI